MPRFKEIWPGLLAGGAIAVAVVLVRADWDAIAASDESLIDVLFIAIAAVSFWALIWWLTRLSYRILPAES